MKIRQIIITACFVVLLADAAIVGAILDQCNRRVILQNEVLRRHNEVKKIEYAIRQKQLRTEQLRNDIENIRFNAFVKAYSKAEYLVEIEVTP